MRTRPISSGGTSGNASLPRCVCFSGVGWWFHSVCCLPAMLVLVRSVVDDCREVVTFFLSFQPARAELGVLKYFINILVLFCDLF
jgi:hypothetical protein